MIQALAGFSSDSTTRLSSSKLKRTVQNNQWVIQTTPASDTLVRNTIRFGDLEKDGSTAVTERKLESKKRKRVRLGLTIGKKDSDGKTIARFRVYNPDPDNIVSARIITVTPLNKEAQKKINYGDRVARMARADQAVIYALNQPQKGVGQYEPCPAYQERLSNRDKLIAKRKARLSKWEQVIKNTVSNNPFLKLGYTGWNSRSIRKAGLVQNEFEMKAIKSKKGFQLFGVNVALTPNKGIGQYFIEYTTKDGKKILTTDEFSTQQRLGANGPSSRAKKDYKWRSQPLGPWDFRKANIYGLHVGTYTPKGRFQDLYTKGKHPLKGKYETMLDFIKASGFNAIQFNPVQQFSGDRGWGYGTTHFFAFHNTYGTAKQFKRLVDECHKRGIRVIMDVVYNHPGPEDSPLPAYSRHKNGTPFGDAINIAEPRTKAMVLRNLLYLAKEFKVDGFRFDQVNILDNTHEKAWALRQIMEKLHQKRPGLMIIAEHENNSAYPANGSGFTHQYAYKLEKALEALITGERQEAYWPHPTDFKKAATRGGNDYVEDLNSLMTFSTTHDVVGNNGGHIQRARKDLNPEQNAALRRMHYTLARLLPGPTYHFNGEMGSDEHFNYFVSFRTKDALKGNVYGRIQDGQTGFSTDQKRFEDSKRKYDHTQEAHKLVQDTNTARATTEALWQNGRTNNLGETALWVDDQYRDNGVFTLWRKGQVEAGKPTSEIFAIANYSGNKWDNNFEIAFPPGKWEPIINTNDVTYGGADKADTSQIDAGHQQSRKAVSLSPFGLTLYRKITSNTQIGSTDL